MKKSWTNRREFRFCCLIVNVVLLLLLLNFFSTIIESWIFIFCRSRVYFYLVYVESVEWFRVAKFNVFQYTTVEENEKNLSRFFFCHNDNNIIDWPVQVAVAVAPVWTTISNFNGDFEFFPLRRQTFISVLWHRSWKDFCFSFLCGGKQYVLLYTYMIRVDNRGVGRVFHS